LEMKMHRILTILCILLAAIAGATVSAQVRPAVTTNRMLCPSIKSLERAIKSLPSADAIESARTIPDEAGQPDQKTGAPACIWIGGSFPIPHDNPFGWLKSGDYIFLVNGVSLNDGRRFVHATTVASARNWRLEDHCSSIDFMVKTVMPTGEDYRFFGFRRKIGFDPTCRNLINTVEEANELNAPRRDFSKVWKSRPYRRTTIGCQNVDGLANALDRMVNEQQVNNSDVATFGSKDGCTHRSVDEIVASRFLGLYKTIPVKDYKASFVVELHQVIFLNKRSGVLTPLFMATSAVRTRLLRIAPECQSSTLVPTRGKREVYLMGANLENVDAVDIDTPLGRRQLGGLTNTPVGMSLCETNERVWRS
jgi:hypothetical protein